MFSAATYFYPEDRERAPATSSSIWRKSSNAI